MPQPRINDGGDIAAAGIAEELCLRIAVGAVCRSDIIGAGQKEDRDVSEGRLCVFKGLMDGQISLHDDKIPEETISIRWIFIGKGSEPFAPLQVGSDEGERTPVWGSACSAARGEGRIETSEDQRIDHYVCRVVTVKENVSVCYAQKVLLALRIDHGVGRAGVNNTIPLSQFFIDRDLGDCGPKAVREQDNRKSGVSCTQDGIERRPVPGIIAEEIAFAVVSPRPAVSAVFVQGDCISGFYHFVGKIFIIIGNFCEAGHDLNDSAGRRCFPELIPYCLAVV